MKKIENRTHALCIAFGWQGGTIHQIAEVTGCNAFDIIDGKLPQDVSIGSDYSRGWFAGRTCSVEHNKKANFPKQKGNLAYWLGVADGLMQS